MSVGLQHMSTVALGFAGMAAASAWTLRLPSTTAVLPHCDGARARLNFRRAESKTWISDAPASQHIAMPHTTSTARDRLVACLLFTRIQRPHALADGAGAQCAFLEVARLEGDVLAVDHVLRDAAGALRHAYRGDGRVFIRLKDQEVLGQQVRIAIAAYAQEQVPAVIAISREKRDHHGQAWQTQCSCNGPGIFAKECAAEGASRCRCERRRRAHRQGRRGGRRSRRRDRTRASRPAQLLSHFRCPGPASGPPPPLPGETAAARSHGCTAGTRLDTRLQQRPTPSSMV